MDVSNVKLRFANFRAEKNNMARKSGIISHTICRATRMGCTLNGPEKKIKQGVVD